MDEMHFIFYVDLSRIEHNNNPPTLDIFNKSLAH